MYWNAFLSTEPKITWPHARWRLTNAVKRRPSRYDKLLQIKPTMVFTFLIFAEICSSSFKSASKITPRSFAQRDGSTLDCEILWNALIFWMSQGPQLAFKNGEPKVHCYCQLKAPPEWVQMQEFCSLLTSRKYIFRTLLENLR